MTTGAEQLHGEKGDTWPKVLQYNCEKYGETRRAMRHKHHGIWRPCTWKDYYFRARSLALGLLSLGFKPGDRLLIVGDNAPEWYYAALAAQAVHGITVAAYSELSPGELRDIAGNSESGFAMVQDQEQVDKFLQVKDEIPLLKKIIYWSYKGLAHYSDPLLIGYREVLELGKKYEGEHPGLFERNVETGRADDVCSLVYTSGTTAEAPRAAVHTYRTLRAGAESHLRIDPWHSDDSVVPYLPPVWINEQWLEIGCHLLSACTLNFAEGPETQQRDATETGPSVVSHGARLWESQASGVHARMLRANALNRYAFALLMPFGYRVADLKFQRKNPGLLLKMIQAFADVALLRSVRRSLGLQNARICYSTGAVLSPDAFRFYHALGLPLRCIYGTTEGGVLVGKGKGSFSPDTVDPVQPGSEVKIAGDGEILYRQPGTFTGYYRDTEKTAEVLRDGWFCSGDIGRADDDGSIAFVDRAKSLVPLASGETLVPQRIESRLRFSPYIKDAWVLAGPQRAYASAVIVIDSHSVGSWAGQRRMAFSTFAELAQRQEVYDLVRQEVDRVNRTLPAGSRIRKYVHLHKEFDPDEGELTRTRKLRRAVLEEHYRTVVDAIYRDGDEVQIEARIGHRDGRVETITTTLRIQSVEGAG